MMSTQRGFLKSFSLRYLRSTTSPRPHFCRRLDTASVKSMRWCAKTYHRLVPVRRPLTEWISWLQ